MTDAITKADAKYAAEELFHQMRYHNAIATGAQKHRNPMAAKSHKNRADACGRVAHLLKEKSK